MDICKLIRTDHEVILPSPGPLSSSRRCQMVGKRPCLRVAGRQIIVIGSLSWRGAGCGWPRHNGSSSGKIASIRQTLPILAKLSIGCIASKGIVIKSAGDCDQIATQYRIVALRWK